MLKEEDLKVRKLLREQLNRLKALKKANDKLMTVRDSGTWVILKDWIKAKNERLKDYCNSVPWRPFESTEKTIADKMESESIKAGISVLSELISLVERGSEGTNKSLIDNIKRLKEQLRKK